MKNLFKLLSFFVLFNIAYGSEDATSIQGPYVTNGDSIFFTGDFLYWTTQIDGLEFARSESGSVKNIPSSWDPGFRVGVGAILPHDKWEVFFEYTRIQNKRSESLGAGYLPLWTAGGVASSSKASQGQTFNDLNISLGRTFIPSKRTLFFPFIGLKGTYDIQHYHVFYKEVAPSAFLIKEANLSVNARQSFWGVGILLGFNSEWQVAKYLALFANIYGAGVTSHFNNSRKDTFTYTDSLDNPITFKNVANENFTLQAMFDINLGLKTDLWFSKERYHLSLQAGWELQTWLHQNQILCHGGNLSFQGLTFKARFDF